MIQAVNYVSIILRKARLLREICLPSLLMPMSSIFKSDSFASCREDAEHLVSGTVSLGETGTEEV